MTSLSMALAIATNAANAATIVAAAAAATQHSDPASDDTFNDGNGKGLQCGLCHGSISVHWQQLRCCRLIFCKTCASALDPSHNNPNPSPNHHNYSHNRAQVTATWYAAYISYYHLMRVVLFSYLR